jgi:Na+-translocating ferredoxin:NAD+ oxidoreductase RnfC subunit
VSEIPRQVDASKVKKTIILKEPVKVPSVTVNGIMWNPQNPLAMLGMPDGTSAVAKVGQVIGEITIKKIEKTFVVILFEKKEYRIER